MGGLSLHADGTSTSSTKEVAGYSIIQAENMKQAHELLKSHPHLAWNGACDIEVHQCAPM